MTEPLYDPLAKFDGATITDAVSFANHVADFTKTAIVELINNAIIDCEADGRDSLSLKGLRSLANTVATMPPPIVMEKGP